MNNPSINVIALAVGLTFSAGALAHNMSMSDYKSGKDIIATEYKWDKERCVSLSGNLNNICMAEAMGKERSARFELEYRYQPSRMTHYQARIAKAEADYAVMKERCEGYRDANEIDICMKEAKAAETAAKTAAEVSDAGAVSGGKSIQALSEPKNVFQACAMNMQAHIAAYRAIFLNHANSDVRL